MLTLLTTNSDNIEASKSIIRKLEDKLDSQIKKLDKKTAEAILAYKSSNIFNPEKTLTHLVSNLEKALISTDIRMIKHTDKSVLSAAKSISEKIDSYIKNGYNLNPSDLIKLFYAIDNDAIQAPYINYDLQGTKDQSIKLIKSPSWWKKHLSLKIKQNCEQIKKITGLIGKNQLYVSDVALAEQKKQTKNCKIF